MKGINLNVKNKIIKDIGRSMGGAGKYIRTTNISKGGADYITMRLENL